jgi:hypothetical protein
VDAKLYLLIRLGKVEKEKRNDKWGNKSFGESHGLKAWK